MPDNKVFYAAVAVLGATALLWLMDMITDVVQPLFIWMLMIGAVILVAGLALEMYNNRRRPNLTVEEGQGIHDESRRAA